MSTAVEAPNDADPAAFWPGEGAPHVGAPEGDDEGVPGRGPLFAVDDPNRPASGTDKRLLSEALNRPLRLQGEMLVLLLENAAGDVRTEVLAQ
ncbi:MAG: hypothetical protein WCR49_14685, partial [Opitutae bacterium]